MGVWSCTILGSDDALVTLDTIENSLIEEVKKHLVINEDDLEEFSFYPLTSIKQDNLNELELKVKELFGKWISEKNPNIYSSFDKGWFSVVSSLIMAYGLDLPERIKDLAIIEAKNDDWAEESDERKAYMEAFIDALNRYETGKPLFEPTEGLFAKITNSIPENKDLSWFEKS